MYEKLNQQMNIEKSKSEYMKAYCNDISNYFKVSCLIIELNEDKTSLAFYPSSKDKLTENAINILVYNDENYIIFENEFARRAQFMIPFNQRAQINLDESRLLRPFLNEFLTIENSYEPMMRPLINDVKQRFKKENYSQVTPSLEKYKKKLTNLVTIVNQYFTKKNFFALTIPIINNFENYIPKHSSSTQKTEAKAKAGNIPYIKSIIENADNLVSQNQKKEDHIALNNCNHSNIIQRIKYQYKQSLDMVQCGPRQLICTNGNCFNIIDDNILIKLFGLKDYKNFILNYDVILIICLMKKNVLSVWKKF